MVALAFGNDLIHKCSVMCMLSFMYDSLILGGFYTKEMW